VVVNIQNIRDAGKVLYGSIDILLMTSKANSPLENIGYDYGRWAPKLQYYTQEESSFKGRSRGCDRRRTPKKKTSSPCLRSRLCNRYLYHPELDQHRSAMYPRKRYAIGTHVDQILLKKASVQLTSASAGDQHWIRDSQRRHKCARQGAETSSTHRRPA
jgi:hypothetical protein